MNNRTVALTAILLLPLFMSDSAPAEDQTGWSLSAAIGASQIEDKDGSETFNGNGFGFSAEIEYRFTPNFALGFGGFSLGKSNDVFNSVDTEIKVGGYTVFGRAIYPVSDIVELYGRVGAAIYFVDIDPGSVDLSDALFGQDAVELGLGVDFGRRDSLAFRLEGRFFNGGRGETGILVVFGVNYLF